MSDEGQIKVDASLALRALDRAENDLRTFFREEAGIIFTRLAARAIGTYMRNARGEPDRRREGDEGPLRIVSGRLARSLGASTKVINPGAGPDVGHESVREGIRRVSIRLNKATLEWGSKVPYARIHELGSQTTSARGPTTKQTAQIGHLKARPYIHPALEYEQSWIVHRIDRDFQTYMSARFGGRRSGA